MTAGVDLENLCMEALWAIAHFAAEPKLEAYVAPSAANCCSQVRSAITVEFGITW